MSGVNGSGKDTKTGRQLPADSFALKMGDLRHEVMEHDRYYEEFRRILNLDSSVIRTIGCSLALLRFQTGQESLEEELGRLLQDRDAWMLFTRTFSRNEIEYLARHPGKGLLAVKEEDYLGNGLLELDENTGRYAHLLSDVGTLEKEKVGISRKLEEKKKDSRRLLSRVKRGVLRSDNPVDGLEKHLEEVSAKLLKLRLELCYYPEDKKRAAEMKINIHGISLEEVEQMMDCVYSADIDGLAKQLGSYKGEDYKSFLCKNVLPAVIKADKALREILKHREVFKGPHIRAAFDVPKEEWEKTYKARYGNGRGIRLLKRAAGLTYRGIVYFRRSSALITENKEGEEIKIVKPAGEYLNQIKK